MAAAADSRDGQARARYGAKSPDLMRANKLWGRRVDGGKRAFSETSPVRTLYEGLRHKAAGDSRVACSW